MNKIAFITIMLLSAAIYAQKEANIWYFGEYAGLDFNTGSPVALLDGQLHTTEGSASIANAQGNLLFYTDGVTVWNKNHEVMENGEGLLGNDSSSQSALDEFDLSLHGVQTLKIYNRYGLDVYSKADYTSQWYGQTNEGNELPDSTYYYNIQKKDGEVLTGWVYINKQS